MQKRGKNKRCFIIVIIILFIFAFLIKPISSFETNVTIDSLVIEKLENQSEVYVTVMLNDNSNITYENVSNILSERRQIYERKADYFIQTEEELISIIDKSEFKLDYKFRIINAFSGYITKKGLNQLMLDPRVLVIETNRVVSAGLDVSAPLINATQVWANGYTGKGQTVCVIDTGINWTHPALGGCKGSGCKVLGGHDYCASTNCATEDTNPMDEDNVLNGHGTHVAGIVASNDSNYRGIAPDVSLIAMKVCLNGNFCGTNAIEKGVDWCVNNASVYNISIITMSLYDSSSYGSDCNPVGKTAATAAISAANDSGIFVDSISGNNGYTNGISWPGCVKGVAAVGASDDSNIIWSSTNRYSNLDLLAPGVGIMSTNYHWESGSDFVSKTGTSMSAPHVAGAAALLLERDPTLTPDNITTILKNNNVSIWDQATQRKYPRIDVLAAINSLCTCTSWTSGSCGTGSPGCNSIQRNYTRTCNPFGCDAESKCEYDETCSGSTITVCQNGSCDYTTIQGAVNNAAYEDLINVIDEGVYDEDVNISMAPDKIFLNCQGATITSNYDAVRIDSNEYSVIMNCIFNATNGIHITGDSDNNEFLNNVFDIEEKGLESENGSVGAGGSLYIVDNIFINAGEEGVYFHGVTGNYPDASYFKRNRFFNNYYATYLKRSIWNEIYDSIFEDNTYGIYFQGQNLDLEETIENNNISENSYGIYIDDQDGVILNNNYFCPSNSDYDILKSLVDTTYGTENRCEKPDGWNDNGVTGCTYYCYGPPTITLLYPPNNYEDSDGDVSLTCEANDNSQLVNITLYHNISGTWQANQTKNITGTSNITTFNIDNLENGTNFIWNCLAYDNMSRGSFASVNWSMSVNIIPQDQHKFYIKNSSGDNVAWLGDEGNIVLEGSCFSGGSCNSPGDNSFIIANLTDSHTAFINSTGNLCIEKGDCSDESSSCNPTRDAFIVRDSLNNNVSYIDFDGDLCLTGKLYENSNYV